MLCYVILKWKKKKGVIAKAVTPLAWHAIACLQRGRLKKNVVAADNAKFMSMDWKNGHDQTIQTLALWKQVLGNTSQRINRLTSCVWHPAIENVFRVCIAWYKHERGWENSRQLCKPSTSSRVCITVKNSPNPPKMFCILAELSTQKRFQIRGCVISARKAKHLDVTTMLTYSHHGYMLSCRHASQPIRERVLS